MAKKKSGRARKAKRRRGTDLSVENLGGEGGDSASAVENLGEGESTSAGSFVKASVSVGTADESPGGGGDSASAVENLGEGESTSAGSFVKASVSVGTADESPGGGGDSASAVENLGEGESTSAGSFVKASVSVGTADESPGGGGDSASAVENLGEGESTSAGSFVKASVSVGTADESPGGGGDSASAVENLGEGESTSAGSFVKASVSVGTADESPGGGGDSASAVENLGEKESTSAGSFVKASVSVGTADEISGGGGYSASAVENLGEKESTSAGSFVKASVSVGTADEISGGGGGDSASAVENLGEGESTSAGSFVKASVSVGTADESPGGGGDSASAVENLGEGESTSAGSFVKASVSVGTADESPGGGGGSASAVENLGRTAYGEGGRNASVEDPGPNHQWLVSGEGTTEKSAESLGSTTEKRRNLSEPSGDGTESHRMPERRETQPEPRQMGRNQYVARGHNHFKGLMDERGHYTTPSLVETPYSDRRRGAGVVELPSEFDPPTWDMDITTPQYRRDLTPYPSLDRLTQLSRTRTAENLAQGVQEFKTNQLWFRRDWRSEGQQRWEAEHRAMRGEASQLRDVADRVTLRANHLELMAIRSERRLILQAESDRRAGQNRAQARTEMEMEVMENESGRRRVEGNPGRLGARREGAITDEEYDALCGKLQTLGMQMVQAEMRREAALAEAVQDAPGNGTVIPWVINNPVRRSPQEPGSLDLNTKPEGESVQGIDEEEMPDLTSGEESDGQRPGPAAERTSDGGLIDLTCPSETPSPLAITEPDQEEDDPIEELEAFFRDHAEESTSDGLQEEGSGRQKDDQCRRLEVLRANQLRELTEGSVPNREQGPPASDEKSARLWNQLQQMLQAGTSAPKLAEADKAPIGDESPCWHCRGRGHFHTGYPNREMPVPYTGTPESASDDDSEVHTKMLAAITSMKSMIDNASGIHTPPPEHEGVPDLESDVETCTDSMLEEAMGNMETMSAQLAEMHSENLTMIQYLDDVLIQTPVEDEPRDSGESWTELVTLAEEYEVMTFGPAQSPASFMQMMENIQQIMHGLDEEDSSGSEGSDPASDEEEDSDEESEYDSDATPSESDEDTDGDEEDGAGEAPRQENQESQGNDEADSDGSGDESDKEYKSAEGDGPFGTEPGMATESGDWSEPAQVPGREGEGYDLAAEWADVPEPRPPQEITRRRTDATRTGHREVKTTRTDGMRTGHREMKTTRTDGLRTGHREVKDTRTDGMRTGHREVKTTRTDGMRTGHREVKTTRTDGMRTGQREVKTTRTDGMRTGHREVKTTRTDGTGTGRPDVKTTRTDGMRTGHPQVKTPGTGVNISVHGARTGFPQNWFGEDWSSSGADQWNWWDEDWSSSGADKWNWCGEDLSAPGGRHGGPDRFRVRHITNLARELLQQRGMTTARITDGRGKVTFDEEERGDC